MSTGLHFLDVGLVIAVFVGIFWWMYSLTAKPLRRASTKPSSNNVAPQPWEDDKAGGRGNR